MPNPPPSDESERKDAENEDPMARFQKLAKGLLEIPRQPVMDAERRFKKRERRRQSS